MRAKQPQSTSWSAAAPWRWWWWFHMLLTVTKRTKRNNNYYYYYSNSQVMIIDWMETKKKYTYILIIQWLAFAKQIRSRYRQKRIQDKIFLSFSLSLPHLIQRQTTLGWIWMRNEAKLGFHLKLLSAEVLSLSSLSLSCEVRCRNWYSQKSVNTHPFTEAESQSERERERCVCFTWNCEENDCLSWTLGLHNSWGNSTALSLLLLPLPSFSPLPKKTRWEFLPRRRNDAEAS